MAYFTAAGPDSVKPEQILMHAARDVPCDKQRLDHAILEGCTRVLGPR